MDFEKICMMFTMQEPYYGILLSSMARQPVPPSVVNTLGVGRDGNVFKLVYNPDFVENLPVDTVLELLKHECLHVAFNHFTLWETDPESKQEHTIRNIAEDLEINGYLDRNKISKSAGGVFAEDFGWQKYLGTREYYDRLRQLGQQQKAMAVSPTQPCNGGQGGQAVANQQNGQSTPQGKQSGKQSGKSNGSQPPQNGTAEGTAGTGQNPQHQDISDDFTNDLEQKSFDDHSMWPSDMSDAEKKILQQAVDELVAFAADEVEKGRGTIPGELKGRIEALRNKKKPKPVADWKRYFRRYVGNEFTEFIRKSKKRESRRFPDAAGNRHRRKSNILVGIDTSGSVSMPEYMEFMGQLRRLSETSNFHVVECDAVIQYEYDYKGKPNETLHGGGGTEFSPVIDLFLENRKKYEALVYFTDGYCYIPTNTPKETMWVISSKGDHNRDKYKVNGAKAVFIPKQNG